MHDGLKVVWLTQSCDSLLADFKLLVVIWSV